ncbi:Plasmodium exported protein (PHIST), unknown function [Plasmodium vivax]|uniref:Plasmodium RESA N-terminal domain-containing protein n=1 Tax=Plasmodium vivax TaxID=5855 RepID=A0A564ZQ74_PLAVI|nr:Plasmodium exported protein (PHIST), unknown function [Plasmodium vivax]
MAFPAFKSVLSVALLYVLYQGNNEYDVHTISEWKNSKRSRNLAEFFPQKTGISGENYGNNEHAQYGNAGLQITNYNKSRVSNVMDLFQDVDITGSSWDNYCSQNEKFDSQYWENHEDPFEQTSTSVPEAYEIPEEDSSIKTAPTSIKKNKKKSKGTSKTRNSQKKKNPVEGRNTTHKTENQKYKVQIIDSRSTNSTKTNEGRDTSKDLAKFEKQLSQKQLKHIIKNLNEIMTTGEIISIYNQVTAMEKQKFYEVLKNLAIFWEDLTKEHCIPHDFVARKWTNIYRDLTYDLIALEEELHVFALDLINDNTYTNFIFVDVIDKIQFHWEEFIFKKDNDTKEYFRKKIKEYYKKTHNISWF